jgi:hypothetical protein
MSEERLEFKVKPFYWKYSLGITFAMGVWSISQLDIR